MVSPAGACLALLAVIALPSVLAVRDAFDFDVDNVLAASQSQDGRGAVNPQDLRKGTWVRATEKITTLRAYQFIEKGDKGKVTVVSGEDRQNPDFVSIAFEEAGMAQMTEHFDKLEMCEPPAKGGAAAASKRPPPSETSSKDEYKGWYAVPVGPGGPRKYKNKFSGKEISGDEWPPQDMKNTGKDGQQLPPPKPHRRPKAKIKKSDEKKRVRVLVAIRKKGSDGAAFNAEADEEGTIKEVRMGEDNTFLSARVRFDDHERDLTVTPLEVPKLLILDEGHQPRSRASSTSSTEDELGDEALDEQKEKLYANWQELRKDKEKIASKADEGKWVMVAEPFEWKPKPGGRKLKPCTFRRGDIGQVLEVRADDQKKGVKAKIKLLRKDQPRVVKGSDLDKLTIVEEKLAEEYRRQRALQKRDEELAALRSLQDGLPPYWYAFQSQAVEYKNMLTGSVQPSFPAEQAKPKKDKFGKNDEGRTIKVVNECRGHKRGEQGMLTKVHPSEAGGRPFQASVVFNEGAGALKVFSTDLENLEIVEACHPPNLQDLQGEWTWAPSSQNSNQAVPVIIDGERVQLCAEGQCFDGVLVIGDCKHIAVIFSAMKFEGKFHDDKFTWVDDMGEWTKVTVQATVPSSKAQVTVQVFKLEVMFDMDDFEKVCPTYISYVHVGDVVEISEDTAASGSKFHRSVVKSINYGPFNNFVLEEPSPHKFGRGAKVKVLQKQAK